MGWHPVVSAEALVLVRRSGMEIPGTWARLANAARSRTVIAIPVFYLPAMFFDGTTHCSVVDRLFYLS
jgi:hypothetical protein